MNGYDTSDDDHQPVMFVRGHAIFAAHFIVLVFVASMIVTTILMASGFSRFLNLASFSSTEVLNGQIWRLFTYGFVNPPSLGFVIDMFMIVWFGRELEKFFGRRVFLRFYGGLYLLSPLLFTLIGLRWPMQLSGETGAFALFIAFATLYPNAMMLFNLLAKWVAGILIALYTMVALAYHDWVGLLSLGMTTGYAYAFVSLEQGRFTLPSFSLRRRKKPNLRVLPDLKPQKAPTIKNVTPVKESSMAEMDALLDKIAHTGMSSLTAKERAQLTKAREQMMQKKPDRT